MDGVIVVDKPGGWTSHDVVAAVKRRLGARKVGHLGTLDPLATGVLPLVINRATKAADRLSGGVKEYLAALKLGEATDTYDSEGAVIARRDPAVVSAADVAEVFARFTGRIRQTPPMYSSVKKGGTPLYRLARKGVTVEREPKDVEIFELEVTGFEPPLVRFRALCSRGTYIRSICHDAGEALGCGAHLVELRRTRSGPFTCERAVGPKDAKEALLAALIPLDEALRLCGA